MAAARAVGAAGGDAAKEAYDSDVLVDEFYAAFSDADRLEGGALDDGEEYAELMGQLMGLGGDLEGAETRYARKKKEVAAHPREPARSCGHQLSLCAVYALERWLGVPSGRTCSLWAP